MGVGAPRKAQRTDLRIAVLGVGMMGSFHVEALSRRVSGAQVTVVNDYFAEKAEEVAGSVGARVVADPIAAINDPEVDAVLIASPGAAHQDQVSACLDAGKPVLCEKPLTTDVGSAYAIVQQEAALSRPLIQVGFMRRFDPEYVGAPAPGLVRRAWATRCSCTASTATRPSPTSSTPSTWCATPSSTRSTWPASCWTRRSARFRSSGATPPRRRPKAPATR